MEIIAIILFWITLYFAADIYYEKVVESLRHPIPVERKKIDEDSERYFRILVFSPVVFLLFCSAFRNMPSLNHPYNYVWIWLTAMTCIGLVCGFVNILFTTMVNNFLKEKYEHRIKRKTSYRVSVIQATLMLLLYFCLRLMN